MKPDQEKIISKIRKLLKLSSSNFDGESEAALLKAQQLLVEHDLSMADIDVSGAKQEVIEETIEFKSVPWWYGNLIAIIADNFRCEVLGERKSHSRWRGYLLIGRDIDVQISKEVFRYAAAIIKHNSKPFKAYGTARINTYIFGFLKGLQAKFQEQIVENQWGLILVKDKEVIDAKNRYATTKARKSSITATKDQEAYYQGYTDGKALDHQKKQIEAGA